MTQDEYRDSLTRMGVSPNTLQALLNAYEAGMHESIDLLTKRKKALDAKYKREPSITTYSRHREVTNLLAALCEASQHHTDCPQSGCEVSPRHHHTGIDSNRGFNDGSGI